MKQKVAQDPFMLCERAVAETVTLAKWLAGQEHLHSAQYSLCWCTSTSCIFFMDFTFTFHFVTEVLNKKTAFIWYCCIPLTEDGVTLFTWTEYRYFLVKVWDLTFGIVIIILRYRSTLLSSLQQDSLFLLYHSTVFSYAITLIFQYWHAIVNQPSTFPC